MNVEIGAEAALFPEKEYIKGIFVAVCLAWQHEFAERRQRLTREPTWLVCCDSVMTYVLA
jgi:hypothetical protein